MNAIEETYKDTERLIKYIVGKFHHKYGGDFDELMCEANELFVMAYKTQDDNRGPFRKRLPYYLWTRLQEKLWKKLRRQHTIKQIQANLELVQDKMFNFEHFVDSMSQDAQIIMTILFDPMPDMILAIRQHGRKTPNRMRKALVEVLEDIGWGATRIRHTFSEITKALENV